MISFRSYLGQQGRRQWGYKKAIQKSENLRMPPFPHTYTLLPGQAHIHTCPPLMIVSIDTIASDNSGHRGTGGGGGEDHGWIVGGEY